MMCAVCMFDGRRQEELIDLKDGQIDQLRAERDAARALVFDIKPAWELLTKGRIWDAATAGTMASLTSRINASMKGDAPAVNLYDLEAVHAALKDAK